MLAIALSGAAALGGEVVWTRLMGLMLGATVYAFSIILAVFLAGLAIGTAAGSALVRRLDAKTALGWCQMLAALGIAWTAYMIADALPYLADRSAAVAAAALHLRDRSGALRVSRMLPPTLFWGASFPLAFAAARGNDPGAAGGRHLCRQHVRRHCRRAGGEPGAGAVDRHPEHPARAAGGVGRGRAGDAGAAWRCEPSPLAGGVVAVALALLALAGAGVSTRCRAN